jgi:hypothetical protein
MDKTWAEFSTLEVAVCMHGRSLLRVKLPSLKLRTWPKQLLGYLPLDIVNCQ